MATLFSYFTKTPKSKKPSSPVCGETAEKGKNHSPKEGAQGFTPINGQKANIKERKSAGRSNKNDDTQVELYDIVWAKLEGHPWWPSLVCDHPTQNVFQQKDKCHVQFFGEPPSRAWVKRRQIKTFEKQFKNQVVDPTIKKAVQQAEEVLLLSKEERKELVNCLPSDEEDSEEDGDQTMKSDDESPSKVTQGHKRKSSGDIANKNSDDDDDDDDDEVKGRKHNNNKRPKRKAAIKHNKGKKRRVIESGSEGDSADEYKPNDDDDDVDESCSSGVDENELEDGTHSEEDIEEDNEKPSRKRKRGSTSTGRQQKTKNHKPSTPCTPLTSKAPVFSTPSPSLLSGSLANKVSSSASKAAESLARFQMSSSPTPSSNANNEEGVGTYTHEKLDWLKEEKRK